MMRWTTLLQWRRNVPIRNIYGPTASYILAFAERQLLANNGHERAVWNVRFRGNNGRNLNARSRPLIANNRRSEKANI